MNDRPVPESVAASLSLSLFASRLVMELSEFIATGTKTDTLHRLCRMGEKVFSAKPAERERAKLVEADPMLGLLPTPEHIRLIPEACSQIGVPQTEWVSFMQRLQGDLQAIMGVSGDDVGPSKEAANRLRRFFDALGDLAIDQSRETGITEPEDEDTTWTIPSLIG